MAQKESGSSTAGKIPLFPEISEFAQSHMQGLTRFQSELMEEIQEANRHCLDRMQSEAALASELTGKLAGAHSLPETAAAYQEWIKRRMEMAADDSKYVMAESEKLMRAGIRLFSNGWSPASKFGGT